MLKSIALNISLAFKELVNNPLRTFLSLLGVAIGVFCIVSVNSVFQSLEANIQSSMATLGNDVLYIGKFAWMPEGGEEYAYWKYKARPTCSLEELEFIQRNAPSTSHSALMYSNGGIQASFQSNEVERAILYAVTYDFNKLQPIDLRDGRFFTQKEMVQADADGVILGHEMASQLFGENINAVGKQIRMLGRKWSVIGVMKKQGQNIAGFKFDPACIVSYHYYSTFNKLDKNSMSGFADPMLMIKMRNGKNFDEMKYEVKGLIRGLRKLRPLDDDNFSLNQLDVMQEQVSKLFSKVNQAGLLIGFFSLIIGIFSVANIMYVSVRERTSQIGLKKALGAKRGVILGEFLIESVILSVLGGLLGLLLVYVLTPLFIGYISKMFGDNFDFTFHFSENNIYYGLALSAFVGIVSGFLPARRAARLNPVDAIRS